MIGQIHGFKKDYQDLIIVLVGKTDKEALEGLKDTISDLTRNTSHGLNQEPRIKIIDKGSKTNNVPKSDNANSSFPKIISDIKTAQDIFKEYSKLEKTKTSENTKAAKQEKPISKRELLNGLSRAKLIKIAEKLDVCSEMERFVYEKEGYVDILSNSRKVTVEKIQEILGK